MVKNPLAKAGDTRVTGSIPGPGRSPGVGNDSPFQYACLEISMDRGTWQVTVHKVTKSWTRLSNKAYIQVVYILRTLGKEGPEGGRGREHCPESECVWSIRMRLLYLFDHREGPGTQGKLISEGLKTQKQLYSTAYKKSER